MTRGGFTLIEVMVALLVGGIAIGMAVGLVTTATDGAARLSHAGAVWTAEANARTWLASALGSVEVGAPGAAPFTGSPTAMAFSSWRPVAAGWMERGRVSLHLAGGRLSATDRSGTLVLADSLEAGTFDYLLADGAGHWLAGWTSPVSAPTAVRIRLERRGGAVDTLTFLIGGRG